MKYLKNMLVHLILISVIGNVDQFSVPAISTTIPTPLHTPEIMEYYQRGIVGGEKIVG